MGKITSMKINLAKLKKWRKLNRLLLSVIFIISFGLAVGLIFNIWLNQKTFSFIYGIVFASVGLLSLVLFKIMERKTDFGKNYFFYRAANKFLNKQVAEGTYKIKQQMWKLNTKSDHIFIEKTECLPKTKKEI